MLKYPTFNKQEYVRLSVIDESTKLSVQERVFHFQTGFRFLADAGHKYWLVFRNFGLKTKMVELAVSYVEPTTHKLSNHDNATSVFT